MTFETVVVSYDASAHLRSGTLVMGESSSRHGSLAVARDFGDVLRCPPWFMVLALVLCAVLSSCSHPPAPDTLVMVIEFSPSNLDPRVGTDAQSERIDQLIFDSLVHRDEHFNMQPWVAESWDIPDPKTYIFHLRRGIRFHDGRPLTARDVKWTLDSIRNGSLITLKATTYKLIDHIDTPDDSTLVAHLSQPDS